MAPDLRGMAAAAILVLLALECLTLCGASPGNTTAPANASAQPTPPPPSKVEKRSQEDIMFGNQQNKPAGGMVDDLYQAPEPQRVNNTLQGKGTDFGTKEPEKEMVIQHQPLHSLPELPDRLDYYDYIQPETSESNQQQLTAATAEEDDGEEDEEAERTQTYRGQEDSASATFGAQRLLASAPTQTQDSSEYPSSDDEYEGSSLLYRRRKRGAFRRLHSPLEDLLSPSGGTFRRRRASSNFPMRLKRDAASNELLSWLLRLRRPPAVDAGPRRKNHVDDDLDIQEYQGPEPEALEVSSVPAYLYDQLGDEGEEEDESGLPASFLESLALQEEGDEWEPPVRGPARRRSSFYPLDYRYVLLPGARKRSGGNGFMGIPNGHFGAMRENNRWPGEPQSGRWGHFPLRPMQQQQQQFLRGPVQLQQQLQQQPMGVMRRRAPMEESDADRLYALASLLASQEGLQDSEDKQRRRRSPRTPASLKG